MGLDGTRARSVFGLPVLSPLGRPAAAWTLATTLVDLTYTAFFVSRALGVDGSWGAGHSALHTPPAVCDSQAASLCSAPATVFPRSSAQPPLTSPARQAIERA